jgi:MGT family glycosyltransferase
MTRFLLLPFPLYGHLNPMAAVATKLAERGAEVQVATCPQFAGMFREAGCEVVEVPLRPRGGVPEKATVAHRAGRLRTIWNIYTERGRVTEELIRRWPTLQPDVAVADVMAPWGARAAAAAGTRYASLFVTYAVNTTMLIDDVTRRYGPRAGALVRRLGLARAQHGLHRRVVDGSALALVNSPPDLQPARDSFDERFHFLGPLRHDTSTSGEADLPWERIKTGPTLYVSAGSVYSRGPEFYRSIAEAYAGSEWTVVIATAHTDPAHLGPLPDNVVARRFVPQSAVLAHSDAFITHAGMNSAMDGVLAGVPMVFVPRAFDQWTIARHLAGAGAGVLADPRGGGQALRSAVSGVVADARAPQALARLSASLAGCCGATGAADLLEELAARR